MQNDELEKILDQTERILRKIRDQARNQHGFTPGLTGDVEVAISDMGRVKKAVRSLKESHQSCYETLEEALAE